MTNEKIEIRAIPDQILEYLKSHSICNEKSQRELNEIFSQGNFTYNASYHPIFNFLEVDADERPALDGIKFYLSESFRNAINGFNSHASAIKNYFDFREMGIASKKVKNLKDAIEIGPASHGGAIAQSIGHEYAYIRSNSVQGDKDTTSPFYHAIANYNPYLFVHNVPASIIHSIYREKLENKEFEENWNEAVKALIGTYPRLLTMLARNPNWSSTELDALIIKANPEYLINSKQASRLVYEAQERVRDSDRGLCAASEDIALLNRYMAGIKTTWTTIRDYFAREVAYRGNE